MLTVQSTSLDYSA